MDIAAVTAKTSTQGSFRMGAVLVRGASIIRKATNQGEKTHPLKARQHPRRAYKGLHAEVAALRGLRAYDVAGADLYVARVLADGTPGLAKPCGPCMEFLSGLNISRVFFTLDGEGADVIKL